MKRHPAAHAVVAVLIVAILAGEVWWLAPHFAEAGRALATSATGVAGDRGR
jgi:hypothetical protein